MGKSGIAAIVVLVLAAVAVAGVRFARSGGAEPRPAPTAVVTERSFTPRVTATGSVRLTAGARVAVGAQVSGVVRRLAVTQGTRVRRGDLIAVLDDREMRSRLDDAEARIRQLRADSAQAAVEAVRAEALAARGAILDAEVVAARTARARLDAQLAQGYAARDLAQLTLERTIVRAPLDGVVASVTTHEGETVASSLTAPTFVTIVDPSRLEGVAIVDETDIGRVRVGQQTEFTVDAYPARTFTGVVTRIAPDATIISGVVDYEVTVRLTGDVAGLRPQMTANIQIATDARRAMVVPSAAVRQGPQGLYAWKLVAGRPLRVGIVAGARQLDVTEITSGLARGDTVLVGGFPDPSTEP